MLSELKHVINNFTTAFEFFHSQSFLTETLAAIVRKSTLVKIKNKRKKRASYRFEGRFPKYPPYEYTSEPRVCAGMPGHEQGHTKLPGLQKNYKAPQDATKVPWGRHGCLPKACSSFGHLYLYGEKFYYFSTICADVEPPTKPSLYSVNYRTFYIYDQFPKTLHLIPSFHTTSSNWNH